MTQVATVRVLLVEDNPGDARLVEILLSETGSSADFEVTHTETLGEALQRLEEATFEVILLDLSLPDSSGLETVEVVRTRVPLTPVVVLTGQDDEEIALQALQSGAEDYLVKGRGDGEMIARSIRYSIERKKVAEALRQREKQLEELVGKLIAAQEEERKRVAHEVHDGPTQMAIAAHQHLQAFARSHPPGAIMGEGELDQALELAQRTVKEVRGVIEGLRPTALDDFGLGVAVRRLMEELAGEGWEVSYEEGLGGRLPPHVETALYRVAQEALSNARKHAKSTRARVALRRLPEAGKIRLEVRDFGRGFDPSAASGEATGPGEKVGLPGMRERVALLRGQFRVESEPGAGTSVIAEVPLPSSSEANGEERA